MTAVLLGWDDKAQRVVEFSVHNPTTLTGLPKTPLNAKWNRYWGWQPLQDGAFGSIVALDLKDTGGLVDIQDASFAYLPNLRIVRFNPKTRSIGAGAFHGCKSLTSIDIPSGVTSIEASAFHGCTSLTSVNIPNGVTAIDKLAFCCCSSLTSINVPSGVTSIGRSAFRRCAGLTSVNIPSGVTSIEEQAFRDCTSLTSINVPSGVTSIEERAFHGCTSLTSISISSGVTSIGCFAFQCCTSLKRINVPRGVTSIGLYAFDDCSLEVVLLEDRKSITLEDLPCARRFVAGWLGDCSFYAQGVSAVGAVGSVSAAQEVDVVSEGRKRLCAPVEDDWRFLGGLDKCPLDE